MTTPETPGREPVTIVELEQKRCSLRFGSAPCQAAGTPKCYQTYSTCSDTPNFTPTGGIKWRFIGDRCEIFAVADSTDADALKTNVIPCLVSVSSSQSKINPGSILDGKSPFGVTAKVTVQMTDIPWDDHIGDFYIADRSGVVAGHALPVRAGFWALFNARNELSGDMFLRIYDGYIGQELDEMRQRLYLLDRISGPNSTGSVTLTGLDPLRLTDDEKAEFPRTSNLDLYGAIGSSTTEVNVFGDEADLSDDFGMDGGRYLRINDEVLSFSGYSPQGNGIFSLTGVARGVLSTSADSHADQDKCQRAARFLNEYPWRVVDYLLDESTAIPDEFRNLDQWDEEGLLYIPTNYVSRVLSDPRPVKDLCGELCQQGLFNIWWAEYDQKIKMLAIRPPGTAPVLLTDEANNLDGTQVTMDPDARLTRIAVFYNIKDQLGSTSAPENYRYRFTSVDDEAEGVIATPITKTIYAPWITSRSSAIALAVRLSIRYRKVPRFMVVYVDAKDRDVQVGTVADIQTASFIDAEGEMMTSRWLVTGSKEVEAGHTYMLDLQTYEYVGRFAVYMADDAPNFDAATDDEKSFGGWFAGDDSKMDDGTEGYRYQ